MLQNGSPYHVEHADCIEHMAELPPASFDCSVFSPPFPSLFCYSSEACDIGNSDDVMVESKLHLSFFYKQLVRVMKPGRVVIVHVMQIPQLARSGKRGLVDFRGLNIRLAERAGFIYEFDWLVTKNPQSQAIRTKAHTLMFVTLERDRAASRGALGDYLIKLRVPGENAKALVSPEVTRNEWIDWAESSWGWSAIRETDTLNVAEGRGEDDVKHICPLQLGVIERCVRLFSDPGEIVFSPFAGIGSEGYVSLLHDRRFYGCEIKPEYHAAALKNLGRAVTKAKEGRLFV